jgi:H+/Cl- antiporter ClcA
MNQDTGKYIIIIGAAIIVIGILIYFFHDKLNWFGRLPGDIRIERDNFRFYFPVMTMILLSILISAILWLIRKFL